jgi:hypothetical protein
LIYIINTQILALLPPIQNNPNESSLNKVLVITKNDLERISGHLNRSRNEEQATLDEIKRKKELHEKSIALTQSWKNTIQGSRRHKLEQKKIREEKLEQERLAVDLEHEKLMAEERKKALEKAKLQQYHETDKVKSFHVRLRFFFFMTYFNFLDNIYLVISVLFINSFK